MVESFIAWLFFLPNILTVLFIGICSESLKNLILGKKEIRNSTKYVGWKRIYFCTHKIQAIIFGMLLGLIPGMMVPEIFANEGVIGAIFNYAGVGAAAMIFYSIIVGNIKAYLENSKR